MVQHNQCDIFGCAPELVVSQDDDDVDERFLAMFAESNARNGGGGTMEAAGADRQGCSEETIECTNAREITRG